MSRYRRWLIFVEIKGVELIREGMDDDSERSTWKYGILTIAINWIPGFVAAVHIIAMYRHRYSPSKTIVAAGNIFCTLFLYLHNSKSV